MKHMRAVHRWLLTLFLLGVAVQYVFANNGPTWFRALHVITALVIASIAGKSTARAWSERNETAST